MKENEFLLIIDGSSLLSTQFFGNLPKEIMFARTPEEKERFFHKIMQTSTGVYTNAVYGFVRVLLKILKEQKPTYLAVAWDVSRDTFRRELYPDYKGNRGETLPPLKDQFMLCQRVLEDMGIPQFMDKRYEADDFSGSLCAKFEDDVPIRILTKDNDYLQLITEKTNLWLLHSTAKKTEELYDKYGLSSKEVNAPDRTFLFTPSLVEQEFGIKPSSVPSLKGIQGDSSDNIKGVPGVGEATAVALIKEYETVDNLYNSIRDLDDAEKKKMNEYWKTIGIKRSPMNALLKESDTELVGEKAAKLSEKLATIKKDIELPITLDDLRVHINESKAQERFDELEFKSLKIASFLHPDNSNCDTEFESMSDLDIAESLFGEEGYTSKATSNPLEREDTNTFGDSVNEKAAVYTSNVSCRAKYKELFHSLYEGCTLVEKKQELITFFDTLIEKAEDLACVGIQAIIEEKTLLGITIATKENVIHSLINEEITKDFLTSQIKRLMDEEITFATFSLKEQLTFLPFCEDTDVFDVEIAAYLMEPEVSTYDNSYVASKYLDCEVASRADIMGKNTYSELSTFYQENFLKAISYEAIIAALAYEVLLEELKNAQMLSLFETIEMPLIYTLYDMEQRGIRVNKAALREYSANLTTSIKELEKSIYEMVGEEFNINSPKQLGEILFVKLKLPNGKKTKTGYSTSADVLEKIKQEDPVIEKILEYRQLTKLKSTYADGLAEYVSEDGRIHGTFNQTIAATGRISSTEPNLQNIPIRMELGRKIRKVFIPKDGFVFLDADYSQIELRVLAHMSGDETLIDAYKTGKDIHRLTASQVFHIPFDEVTSQQRSNAKAVNFGIVYGISAFSLSEDLKIKKKEADEYIEKYFETYPKVKQYLDSLITNGREQGFVTTLYGRIRRLPDMNHSNFIRRSGQERIAMNSPIQGTAADIIKIAMIRVNQSLKSRGLESQLLLQIHDELLVEAKISEVEEVKKLMQEEMENACELLVPMIAEVNQGNDWYDAK